MGFKQRSKDNKLPHDPSELKELHLKALKAREAGYDQLVGKGLALRVAPSGRITFRYIYRFDGRQRTVTVGSYPINTLAVLRGKYLKMAAEVSMGVDPADKIRKASEEQKKHRAVVEKKKVGLTVGKLIDQFIAYIEDPKHFNNRGRPWSDNTKKSYRAHLNNHFAPKFSKLLVADLDARDISAWLGEVAIGTPILSNRILGTLRVLFNWATDIDRGYMEINPAAAVRPKGIEKSKTRSLDYNEEIDHVVDIGEIRRFWNGMEGINPIHKLAMQMILLTGQRPNEVYSAKWEHIPEGADIWILPASITKNRKIHKIPVTEALRAHLKAIHKLSGHTPYLFPRSRHEDGVLRVYVKVRPIVTTTISDLVRRTFMDMKPWTPHDLRRTISTHLKSMGVNEFEVGQLLNHTFTGVTGVYARGTDIDGMRKNLNKWHRKLDRILNEEQTNNVVSL